MNDDNGFWIIDTDKRILEQCNHNYLPCNHPLEEFDKCTKYE